MNTQYHKIQTIFKRDPETKFKTLLLGYYSTPEIEYLKDCDWTWEEKIDGTNIRVIWYGLSSRVSFGGKTDNAQLYSGLVTRLQELFTQDKMLTQFGCDNATLYGEGCGPKIQKGGHLYFGRNEFVLFDVRVGNWWLKREDVDEIANNLGCRRAPVVLTGNLIAARMAAEVGFQSAFQADPVNLKMAEGLVGRPLVELTARDGGRIITKIKTKDFI